MPRPNPLENGQPNPSGVPPMARANDGTPIYRDQSGYFLLDSNGYRLPVSEDLFNQLTAGQTEPNYPNQPNTGGNPPTGGPTGTLPTTPRNPSPLPGMTREPIPDDEETTDDPPPRRTQNPSGGNPTSQNSGGGPRSPSGGSGSTPRSPAAPRTPTGGTTTSVGQQHGAVPGDYEAPLLNPDEILRNSNIGAQAGLQQYYDNLNNFDPQIRSNMTGAANVQNENLGYQDPTGEYSQNLLENAIDYANMPQFDNAASGQSQNLVDQSNNQERADDRVRFNDPNADPLSSDVTRTARDQLALGGKLDAETQAAAIRGSALSSSGAGISGSGAARGLTARDLGRTSMDVAQQRLDNASKIGANAQTEAARRIAQAQQGLDSENQFKLGTVKNLADVSDSQNTARQRQQAQGFDETRSAIGDLSNNSLRAAQFRQGVSNDALKFMPNFGDYSPTFGQSANIYNPDAIENQRAIQHQQDRQFQIDQWNSASLAGTGDTGNNANSPLPEAQTWRPTHGGPPRPGEPHSYTGSDGFRYTWNQAAGYWTR